MQAALYRPAHRWVDLWLGLFCGFGCATAAFGAGYLLIGPLIWG